MIGRRKEIPESGEYDRPVTFYRRVDKPADNHGAKQVDTEIISCFCHLQPIGTLIYYASSQVSNKPTHYLYVDYIKDKTDPQTLIAQGTVAKMRDTGLTYRVVRALELKHNFALRYEVIELGRDNPEGADAKPINEVIYG